MTVLARRWIPSWAWSVFSTELRKALAYRMDFWISFFGSVFAEVGVAYFLWKAIFTNRGLAEMGGYSFHGMMFYYLLAPFVARTVRGHEYGSMAQDIYEGALTRYLIYPLPYFSYKWLATSAASASMMIQMIIAVVVFVVAFGVPAEIHLDAPHLLMGVTAMMFASVLYFTLAAIFELVAFWADNVWSLMVLLRFSTSLLGGSLIPLSFFPPWALAVSRFSPFPYLISFPTRCILGQVDLREWAMSLLMIIAWSLGLSQVVAVLWRRGIRQYTGVGM